MNLLIVDDHEIVRDGLSLLLEQSYCIDSLLYASDGYEALKLAENFRADLVLLDVSMPGGRDGLTTLEKMRKLLPEAKIAIFSMHDDIGFQREAFEKGADGYLVKVLKREELTYSLDQILAGRKVFSRTILDEECVGSFLELDLPITKREKEVFTLTVMGYSQKDIAEKLDISVKTVENHRHNIGEKLGTHKRYDWVDTARKYRVFTM
ncbi:response regulator [Bacillus massilinigeriensis]|uniref:response regulator n=1 Tax=Bacillus mediterraneensis TaxID=1805474 RepID=UPI0008F960B4|nr:response regulator transcription factor [Bacillus mediterraneensis]